MTTEEPTHRPTPSKLQRHVRLLIWKSYLQRQRKWRLLSLEALFGAVLYLAAVFIANPVFMTPVQVEPEPPLAAADLLASIDSKNLLGYAPNTSPYNEIMKQAISSLHISETMQAATEDDLNEILYQKCEGTSLKIPVIWVIWKPQQENIWRFSIRSTERALYATSKDTAHHPNPHLRAGCLAVQLAVSHAILEHVSKAKPDYHLSLVSMPVSPLMQETRVRTALSGILLCFTLAMLPPVLDTQALVVTETTNKFKHVLRLREVGYSSMYMGWLAYAYLTALPVCLLGAITLIQIFRWIHLIEGLLIVMAYISLMMMFAMIMAMFNNKAWVACTWSCLLTMLQTYLAELLVHHKFDASHYTFIFFLHWILPPLGLVDSLHQFALLETGSGAMDQFGATIMNHTIRYTLISWSVMILLYFGILMLLQRTIGQERAIGGQVSWKSIIFKKAEDGGKLHPILHPNVLDREKLQEVDELVAKAISFRNVSKNIMGVQVLNDITLDIYRGEYTVLFTERIQKMMLNTIESLLTGLTYADKGTINVLGETLNPGRNVFCCPQMMGYCHRIITLIDDLTVKEHLIMFLELSLWKETKQNIIEYTQVRLRRLFHDCDLDRVRNVRVGNLGVYYRAQLCWAIAMIVEPRIVVIPNFNNNTTYMAVIKDKILKYRKYLTIIKMSFSSVNLEYGDRIFWFDRKLLVFGGTPAYMFFKYGREYRIRMTLRSDGSLDDERIVDLLNNVRECGGTVRAHLGSLLILRLPTTPTATVAKFVKEVTNNSAKYGVTSFNISLPDSEEVSKRAINESRRAAYDASESYEETREALKRLGESVKWERKTTLWVDVDQLKAIMWKYFSFYLNNKVELTVTLMSAVVAGVFLGLSMTHVLSTIQQQPDMQKLMTLQGPTWPFVRDVLTVEEMKRTTTLVVRLDNSTAARSVAHGYVLSETNATKEQTKHMYYTALARPESITEYLVTRAIDSPQLYVFMYAYGLDVFSKENGTLSVQALYSPLHADQGSAARSLARVYMALIRHYTGHLDASIEVTDDPLSLDLSPWMRDVSTPPLFIQLLLILTIVHITLVPSQEYGYIRHIQAHAMNCSPAIYWLSLYVCDSIMYWALAVIMSIVMICIMVLILPLAFVHFIDLSVVPLMLIVYGIGCIPQAYLFSLGPRATLNTVTYAIVNIVFGETTIIAKIFYGNFLDLALNFMSLSPQFNMASAYVKIHQIFLYNSECLLYKINNVCSNTTLHKCCGKCGILQGCFSRRDYLSHKPGVLMEVIAIFTTAIIFISILLIVQYRVVQRVWLYFIDNFSEAKTEDCEFLNPGAAREKMDVLDKRAQLNDTKQVKVDTFGEYILASNVSKKGGGVYAVHNVYLGLAKGEALALSGLEYQGRVELCEILAGYKMPSSGSIWAMSKWKLEKHPHKYSRQVSLCCERESLPSWMTAQDALRLIAILRGVPTNYVTEELSNVMVALELHTHADSLVRDTSPNYRARLHFAAAVIGAPPVIILDEPTAYQKFSTRRAMYYIIYHLRKRGHAVFISSSSVESHMPVTSRMAVIADGQIYDLDTVDSLVERYSNKGYTVVVHLKDEVNVAQMFANYFKDFTVNDTSEVLVNIQVLDTDLNWTTIFERMEKLQAENQQVYSYIITAIPIDYIYNCIVSRERGNVTAPGICSCAFLRKFIPTRPKVYPTRRSMNRLQHFERKFDVTQLKELPWSVIFHT